MYTVKDQNGFTLFETLIYIALFTFIMGGAILSAYQIFEGSAQIQRMAQTEVELNFLLRKIDWALNGATSVSVQNSGDTLQVVRDAGQTFKFTQSDGIVTLERVSSATRNLTSARFPITELTFVLADEVLSIDLTVDGEHIGPITKLIR
jgi:type II secretory pathway component PulJ